MSEFSQRGFHYTSCISGFGEHVTVPHFHRGLLPAGTQTLRAISIDNLEIQSTISWVPVTRMTGIPGSTQLAAG
jgi:hypothetical protein